MSKQLDFSITQEVLRAYGDAVKDQVRRVLKAIAAAREDGVEISVTGMDEFDIADFSTELSDAQALVGVGSGFADVKERDFQEAGAEVFERARQEVKDRIVEEIEGMKIRRPVRQRPGAEELRAIIRAVKSVVCRSLRERHKSELGGTSGGKSLEQRVNELVAGELSARRRRKPSGARRFGRNCNGWEWRRSIWRTGR